MSVELLRQRFAYLDNRKCAALDSEEPEELFDKHVGHSAVVPVCNYHNHDEREDRRKHRDYYLF